MAGVDDNDAVVVWKERGEQLVTAVKGRSKAGAEIAVEVADRVVSQEKDIEALLGLLAIEKERVEALTSGIDGYTERKTVDGELERLREYVLSVRMREVAAEKRLNAYRQRMASLEARLVEMTQKTV